MTFERNDVVQVVSAGRWEGFFGQVEMVDARGVGVWFRQLGHAPWVFAWLDPADVVKVGKAAIPLPQRDDGIEDVVTDHFGPGVPGGTPGLERGTPWPTKSL